MGVFNRRNAAVGWVAWAVGKRVLKRKAKDAVPAIDRESRKPNRSAIALVARGRCRRPHVLAQALGRRGDRHVVVNPDADAPASGVRRAAVRRRPPRRWVTLRSRTTGPQPLAAERPRRPRSPSRQGHGLARARGARLGLADSPGRTRACSCALTGTSSPRRPPVKLGRYRLRFAPPRVRPLPTSSSSRQGGSVPAGTLVVRPVSHRRGRRRHLRRGGRAGDRAPRWRVPVDVRRPDVARTPTSPSATSRRRCRRAASPR